MTQRYKIQTLFLVVGIILSTIGAILVGAFHEKNLFILMSLILVQLFGALLIGVSIGIGLKRTNKQVTFSADDEATNEE